MSGLDISEKRLPQDGRFNVKVKTNAIDVRISTCLLYTSDAADERSSVDLGGRRIIKKKNKRQQEWGTYNKYDEVKYTNVAKKE